MSRDSEVDQWDLLTEDLHLLEDLYHSDVRVTKILDMTKHSSDTAKFVLRLVYLIYGQFSDPMSMSQEELVDYAKDSTFKEWFTQFMLQDLVTTARNVQTTRNKEQFKIARRFLNVEEYALQIFEKDPVLFAVVLRMYLIAHTVQ